MQLVSHTPSDPATTPAGSSTGAVTSANGAFVAFVSQASLVAGQSDTNGNLDVFLFQRATGVVTLVSHSPAGATTAGNALSSAPAISADGAYVAFLSQATNLVEGQSDVGGTTDVFLYSRATGTVTLVSHASTAPTTTTGAAGVPSISGDGAFVAFESSAPKLVAAQMEGNSSTDVFLFERATGAVTLVSRTPGGPTATGNDSRASPSISADGNFVAFQSFATW